MDEQKVMSKFSYDELHRLVRMIPETDPTTHAYGILLESIERYGAIIPSVEWVFSLPDPTFKVGVVPFNPPTDEAEKFEEGQLSTGEIACVAETTEKFPVEEVAPSYTADEVRKVIQKARMDGKISSAKSWIQENFEVDGFSALPASKYDEVMDKLKELG